jgi:hypothetical protein
MKIKLLLVAMVLTMFGTANAQIKSGDNVIIDKRSNEDFMLPVAA